MKYLVLLIMFSGCSILIKGANEELTGIYSDGFKQSSLYITKLELYKDSTFLLDTVDPVFPYTHKSYTNKGKWISKGEDVILNPHLLPRNNEVEIVETFNKENDETSFYINYLLEEYENDTLIKTGVFDF